MKQFLKKLLVFAVAVLLISLGIQLLATIRIRHKIIYGSDNLDMEQPYNDLVFMGSSRCFVHFNPALFESALHLRAANIGVDGHSELAMHKLRLLNYLARNKAPRYVIFNFDPLVAAGSVDSNIYMVNKNQFARYAFAASATDRPIVDYFKFNLAEKYIPLYALLRYQLFSDCLILPNDKAWKTFRYAKVDAQWDTLAFPVQKGEMLVKSYFDTSAAGVGKITAQLASLDSICRQHAIRLICVQTPVYKTIYRERNFALPGGICGRLGIPFFDLNTDQVDGNRDYFFNSDHLNTKGVAPMTAQLLSDSTFRKLFKPA